MIKIVNAGPQECQAVINELKSRVGVAKPEVERTVADIIEAVRTKGDEAVTEYQKKQAEAKKNLDSLQKEKEELLAREEELNSEEG